HAREYLDAGVTTVRDLGHGGGRDILLRDRIGAGLIVGPDIIAAARRLTPPGGEGMTAASTPEGARNIAEVSGGRENALRMTREVMQTGANVIKVVVNVGSRLLMVEELSAIAEEAHRAGLKVAAHATSAAAIKIAVDAGVGSVEHGNEVSEEMLGEMVRRGIFLVPNSFTEQSLRRIFAAELRRHPADQPGFEAFIKENQQQSLRRMQLAMQAKVK